MLQKEGLCNISVLPGYCARGPMVVGLLKVRCRCRCRYRCRFRCRCWCRCRWQVQLETNTKQAEACNTDTTPTQPHRNSNTHRTKNNTTNVVIEQNSRKLLMMDMLMSETCWALMKWNKIASDIKLVFYSSTITMMHSPINIRHTHNI